REGPEIAGPGGKVIKTDTPERAREDLVRIINEKASPEQIAAHPVVREANAYNNSRPPTTALPGYGTPEFKASREFTINGEKVRGYDQAIPKLVDQARSYSTKGEVKREREAILVWGPPAAGKSKFAEKLAAERRAAIADPDDVKKTLPEFEGGRASSAVHEESSEISADVLKRLVQDGDNLVLPRVGHDLEKARAYVTALQDQGYHVSVVNMTVDPAEAYRRMIRRFLKTGRVIGSDYFTGVGTKPRENYYTLKNEGIFDEGIDINANGAPGTEIVFDAPESRLAADLGFGQRDRGQGLEGAAKPAEAKAAPEAETVAAEPVQAAYEAQDRINELTPTEQKRELPKFDAARDGTLPHPGPDKPAGVFMFDPLALGVDATRFQFKSGGDEYGVTGALRGVQKWDPAKAQAIMVWEQNDGKLFVADGHQRAGLAKRLTAEGKAQGIELPGILYREVDGISAEDMRALAAVTNIANGSGSAFDGAKV
ncbi:MAG TPA: zeta toxin family protein, partial [Candidatus Dormibacteraeota bacterium]|nr:zeta toxin family protein [Candidatus Dormibacteraeota bacterium]